MFPFYDGWLNVERSMIHAMDNYVTQSMLSFPGGWVEMRHFRWSQPLESVCTTTNRCYMVNLLISGWVTGGSAKYLHAIRRQNAETIGRMWLVPPEQTLQFNSIEGHSRSIRCALDAELFESFLADAPRWRENEDLLHAAFNISGGQVEWLLRRMYRELRDPDFATPQIIETLAKQLTVEIIRTLKLRREDTTHYIGGLAPWRLRLIRNRLWSEEALPSLEELANLCDMTVRHLSRTFRAETGGSLGKHVETAMIDRANRMLGGGMPVREVATALGYATSGSFAAAFRRATGLLPSEVNATRKDTQRHTGTHTQGSTKARGAGRAVHGLEK
jgi:AraC family transcriptional regulator